MTILAGNIYEQEEIFGNAIIKVGNVTETFRNVTETIGNVQLFYLKDNFSPPPRSLCRPYVSINNGFFS